MAKGGIHNMDKLFNARAVAVAAPVPRSDKKAKRCGCGILTYALNRICAVCLVEARLGWSLRRRGNVADS